MVKVKISEIQMWLFKRLLPKCAGGARKEECGADGEMKGAEDGLTAPVRKKEKKNIMSNQIKHITLLTRFMLRIR